MYEQSAFFHSGLFVHYCTAFTFHQLEIHYGVRVMFQFNQKLINY